MNSLIVDKFKYLKDIIKKSIDDVSYIQNLPLHFNYKHNIDLLKTLYTKCNSYDIITLDLLQNVMNELSLIFKQFGTKSICDIINICIGTDYINNHNLKNNDLFNLISEYFRPIRYKTIKWNGYTNNYSEQTYLSEITKEGGVSNVTICQFSPNIDCFDLARTSNIFYERVYGIRVVLHNYSNKSTMIVDCISVNNMVDIIDNKFIKNKLDAIDNNYFKKTLLLKDLLVYDINTLNKRFEGYKTQSLLISKKPIKKVINNFINNNLFLKRKLINTLVVFYDNIDMQLILAMLYDLLENNANGYGEKSEKNIIYNSLSWPVKQLITETLITRDDYVHQKVNSINNDISLEDKIILMKADDKIKQVAFDKLKYIKKNSDDSSSNKKRQFVESLLNIPFGCYKTEDIFMLFNDITPNELSEFNHFINHFTESIKNYIENMNRNNLIHISKNINLFIKTYKLQYKKICYTNKTKVDIRNNIIDFCEFCDKKYYYDLLKSFNITDKFTQISNKMVISSKYMNDVKTTLNNAVYGHSNAKSAVEKIIAQWINGKQSGYCLGFEGPPGVGKTSLAKYGIAKCMIDNEGNSRPFAFIGIGGSTTVSTLSGHDYTYLASSWGRFVDILMKSKCMNPIIFIDELDKISSADIYSLLTHITDPTQNMEFQDKYFSGIDIDLSKVLFIFSYNDASKVDKILLDRIHRIKFDKLTIPEKLVIAKNHLLPEIYNNMGFSEHLNISDDNLTYLINNYTNEAGVRKLKQIIFDIIGQINLSILNHDSIPNVFTNNDLDNYLKSYTKIDFYTITEKSTPGCVNGLWGNSLGQGGVSLIEMSMQHSNEFLKLHTTGMQGKVLKESIDVAKTLAWNLAVSREPNTIEAFIKNCNKFSLKGIHVHMPAAATPKDGPSGGVAHTCAFYSLFTNKSIPSEFAFTGEIDLHGNVLPVGGIDMKIPGGIRAGVKNFIIPKRNQKEYDDYCNKFGAPVDINIYLVEHILQVFDLIL